MNYLKIKLSLAFSGHIESDKEGFNLDLFSEFLYKEFQVKIYFDLEEVLRNYSVEGRTIYYKSFNKIYFEVSNLYEHSYNILSNYVKNNKLELYKLLLRILNLTLMQIPEYPDTYSDIIRTVNPATFGHLSDNWIL